MTPETVEERARHLADRLAATNAIGEEQAKVYVFRDVFGFGRAETANLLDKNPNTVDNLRATASRRIFEVRKLLDVLERDSDLVAVRRSRNKTWHRDEQDPRACRHAAGVMLREPYEYRVIPESDLETLSGELCSECFADQ